MEFRIQKRKFSSNVIESSKDGEKWTVYLIPSIKKIEGDPLCMLLLNLLNVTEAAEKLEEKLYGPVKSHQDWANRFNIRGDIRDLLRNKAW